MELKIVIKTKVLKKCLSLVLAFCMAFLSLLTAFAADGDDALGTIAEVFPDANLAIVIADAMGKNVNDTVSASELESMPYLDGNNKNIYSLEGMQYVKRARTAYFMNNHITDLRPVKDLTVTAPRAIRFDWQTVECEPAQLKGGKISVKNPFIDKTALPTFGIVSDISEGGVYNIFTNSVDFYRLSGEGAVSFSVEGFYTNVGPFYSCTVTQPYYA